MNAKIGYDGNAPEFREARDLAGKGKREKVLGPQNIRIDRLEWLLAHKRIESYQHAAGRKLQKHSETAQIGGFSTFQGGMGGSHATHLSDTKCDAVAAVNEARKHVGNGAWRILELVVIDNFSLEKAAAHMRIHARGALPALHIALDALARHYGLA